MSSKNALENLIELASNVADAFTTALYTVNLEDGTLKLRSHLTLSPYLKTDATFAIGDGLLGQAALHRDSRVDDFAGADASHLEWYSQPEDIKGLMIVPVVRRELEGILVVDSKENYSFTPKLQKLIGGFADQMAWYLNLEKSTPNWIDGEPADFQQMMKWCRFLNESPHRKALSERFLHIPRSLIQCDATAVVWFESDGTGRVTHSKGWGQGLKSLEVESGTGICGSCLDSGQNMLVPNTMNHPWIVFSEDEPSMPFGSVMAAPIANEKRMLGMVVCATRKRNGLKQPDMDRLTLMTHFVASALSQRNAPPQPELILNQSEKKAYSSEYFLPVHVKALEAEIIKHDQPISVMSIRIENTETLFKERRQERSDFLLNQITTYLSGKIDALKMFMRHSDEGLILILPGQTEQEIYELEYSVRETLSGISFNLEGVKKKLGFEFGLASFPTDGSDLKVLIETSWAQTTQSEESVHG
jgi:putative methionine-R-sulfoxide reductase with GAF domain/GGDEF domain-containing protein